MDPVNVNQLLSQLRALAGQAEGAMPGAARAAPAADGASGFGSLLSQAVNSVNQSQSRAQQTADAFSAGTGDLPTAMLAASRAQVEFRATTEVRNRLVQAYRDVMNMTM